MGREGEKGGERGRKRGKRGEGECEEEMKKNKTTHK